MHKSLWGCFLLVLSGCLYADEVQIVGSIDQTIATSSHPSTTPMTFSAPTSKHITLLKVHLPDTAWRTLDKRMSQVFGAPHTPDANQSALPPRVQLGMNQVPVLDQGAHGTCVTFAATGAIDAAMKRGDYVSQLCPLQLGRHLEKNAYTLSGWDGSWGKAVLTQINLFGIVSKPKQQAFGCGGLKEYPLTPVALGNEMSVTEYHSLSQNLQASAIVWNPILDPSQLLLGNAEMSQVLDQVKSALNNGDRLTIGVLLPDSYLGVAGAIGSYHTTNDTWVLTPEIASDYAEQTDAPGHEMIITGYDDLAEAIDNQGRPHRGLLTLRNSWGSNVGDKGDFYMSYDYFKTLAIEANRIRKLH